MNFKPIKTRALFICLSLSAFNANADFSLSDITNAVGQVKKSFLATLVQEIALHTFPLEWV